MKFDSFSERLHPLQDYVYTVINYLIWGTRIILYQRIGLVCSVRCSVQNLQFNWYQAQSGTSAEPSQPNAAPRADSVLKERKLEKKVVRKMFFTGDTHQSRGNVIKNGQLHPHNTTLDANTKVDIQSAGSD